MAIQRGEIVSVGRHKIMCGDSRRSEDVRRLMGGEEIAVVMCSPPYLEQRCYGLGRDNPAESTWDEMMQDVFSVIPTSSNTQLLVNLGLVHKNNEWVDYWREWCDWMSRRGLQKRGWYVWDKMDGLPIVPAHGRLYNCHEFVFHFSEKKKTANRTVLCKNAGKSCYNVFMHGPNGRRVQRKKAARLIVNTHRIADSVVRVSCRGHRYAGAIAPYPPRMASEFIKPFSSPGDVVYDPFLGSGSTIVAAESCGRRAYGMELSPKNCSLAIERIQKLLRSDS